MAMTKPYFGIRVLERTKALIENASYQVFMKCQLCISKALWEWSNYPNGLKGLSCIPHKQMFCGKPNQVLHLYSFGRRSDVELALLCIRMFPEEYDKVERYVDGLPDMIQGSVVASKPKTIQEATEMATELMDKKISTFAERQAENKWKLDNNRQAQQQLPKRQNVARAYATGTGERKEYVGTLPMWHYRSDCPELKNGNQAGSAGTRGMVHALVGGGETDQDLNNIKDEIEA
ncbi:hypothetical protein Tco_0123326 [Tanacetum coccineum]